MPSNIHFCRASPVAQLDFGRTRPCLTMLYCGDALAIEMQSGVLRSVSKGSNAASRKVDQLLGAELLRWRESQRAIAIWGVAN